MKLNGKFGKVEAGSTVISSLAKWNGTLDVPTEEFEALGADGKDVYYLETANLSVGIEGLADVGDAGQDSIIGNVLTVNDGTPEVPGVDTPPTWGTMTLKLYMSDTRVIVGDFIVTPESFGAEQGKMTPFKAKAESSGGIKLYTGGV